MILLIVSGNSHFVLSMPSVESIRVIRVIASAVYNDVYRGCSCRARGLEYQYFPSPCILYCLAELGVWSIQSPCIVLPCLAL